MGTGWQAQPQRSAMPEQPPADLLLVEPSPGKATAADRLTFATFIASAVHAALILGLTFTYVTSRSSTHTMEVTLAQHQSQEAPDAPDYLAQFNQTGSGTLEEKALLTSPFEADFHDTAIQETAPFTPPPKAGDSAVGSANLLATLAAQPDSTTKDTGDAEGQAAVADSDTGDLLLARALEIASLEARLDSLEQRYAKRPRIKRLTSLSAASAVDAFYLNSWRRNIERVGNLNYPEEASRKDIYGSLRLLVALLPDGTVKEIDLLESSGHPELDAAAIRIVRLAAPFAPFPDELRQTTDILEIIRTWQFRKNKSLRSY